MTRALSVVELRDLLGDPTIYPHDPDHIEIEQTHISVVAVVAPWVYKFKKPLDLGFLDFSTLEKRRHYCQEEVRLNRRMCPEIYDGVVPLVKTDGGYRVDPSEAFGQPVDYAVKMKYIDTAKTLEARVHRGDVSPVHVDRVARQLCAFYRETTATPETAEAGWIETLRVNIDENFDQTRGYVGRIFSQPCYDALRYYFDRVLDQRASLFHRRRAGGFVIEGHGDLRLDHAHLTEDRVCIVDCIEFNERFRYLDIANDVAFLAMDLDVAGRSDLAERFVDQVVDGLGDQEMRALLPFYKCYRAHVRTKVEAIRAGEEEVPAPDRSHSEALAHRHSQWALRYAVADGKPLVVVVMGRPATGKSTQAKVLAEALGWAHVASDRVRKRKAGVPVIGRADTSTRERLYTSEMTEATYRTLQLRAVERGQDYKGTVLDATYSSPGRRAQLRSTLRAAGLPYVFVELTASDAALRERLADRTDDADTASDARLDDFDLLNERYQAPDALEDARHIRVDTERTSEDTTLAILKALVRLNETP